jgi:hypothetical protein
MKRILQNALRLAAVLAGWVWVAIAICAGRV